MVLYRKYRPQTLEELIGQETVKQSLASAYSLDKLAHAYIFCGPRGTGKTSTARILAKMVNCDKSDISSKKSEKVKVPCNKCPTCISITNGSNLDLIEIDAASNRGIDDIRSLRETIKLAPNSSNKKVYIIDEVHMLTTEAFNALLKSLEEPPNHTLFILATTELQKVPQTILSRTTRLDFQAADTAQLLQAIKGIAGKESIQIDDNSLKVIAKMAQGSFRDAVKMLDQISSLPDINLQTVEQFIGGSRSNDLITLVQLIAEGRSDLAIKQLLSQVDKGVSSKELNLGILDILRQLMLVKNNLGKLVRDALEEVQYNQIISLADKMSLEKVTLLIDRFQKSFEEGKFVSIPSLPLEVAVVESCISYQLSNTSSSVTVKSVTDKQTTDKQKTYNSQSFDIQKILDRWSYILETIRPHNYSLEALLRSSKIKECNYDLVTVEVPYSFHQRILEAPKSKELLESILSDVLGRSIKLTTVLGQRPQRLEDIANVEVAQDDEIIRAAAEIFNSDSIN